MNYNAIELRSFIKSRELIDVRKLAEASGVPKLRLMNFLDNSQDLTEKQVSDLENVLADYGYRSQTVID